MALNELAESASRFPVPVASDLSTSFDFPGEPGESRRAVPPMGITVYGCDHQEADLFRERGPHFGILPTITDAAVSEANLELAYGNRCICIGHKTPISESTLLALYQVGVRYISTRSIGRNHIDGQYAQSIGISVENISYSPDSVADYTLMLILMALRNAKSIVNRAQVHDYRLNDVRGKELRDMTVGVVGVGRIGTAVIERLRGFGCRVVAHDHVPHATADYAPLDALIRQSDIVTLHVPLSAETRHLIGRERINRMKRGAIIINTGRGSLVDTKALLVALEDGSLGGAALDVLEGEEGVFYRDCRGKNVECDELVRLQNLPNVLISPHTAYYTDRALRDTVEHSIINCINFQRRTQRE